MTLALLLLSVLAALGYAVTRRPEGDILRSLLKTSAVALLALAAAAAGAPPAIVAGLALGALGDWLLTRPGERAFIAGMAAFGAGHLAYAGQFLAWRDMAFPPLPPALAFMALALSTELWLSPHAGRLRWPVRGYIVVIGVMALSALTMTGRPWLMAGAGLFVLSDLLLAFERFTPAGRDSRALVPLVWVTYWAAQALILAGSLATPPLSLGA